MEKRKLELILFISGEAVSINKISDILNIENSQVIEYVNELNYEYKEQQKGFFIIEVNNKFEFATNDMYKDLIEQVINSSSKKGLSDSMLEVLSIIAYKGPITKAKINHIRGLNSDYVVNKLLDRDLIQTKGKLDVHGKPNLYVVTERFLKNFGLKSLKDLPEIK